MIPRDLLQVYPAVLEHGEELCVVLVRLVDVDRRHDDGHGQEEADHGKKDGGTPGSPVAAAGAAAAEASATPMDPAPRPSAALGHCEL